MGLVVVALDGGVFERAVHALNLTVGPRVIRLGESVVDLVLKTHPVEDVRKRVPVFLTVGELNPVISEHGVQLVRRRLDEVAQKLCGDQLRRAWVQFGVGDLTGAVNRHEQIQLPFFGSDLGNINVEVPQRIVFERFSCGLLPICCWESIDPVAYQTAM